MLRNTGRFLCRDPAFGDFLAVDGICLLNHFYFFSGYFADDTNSEARSRERLTEYQFFRNSKLQTCLTDLILEQVAQRLDDLLEINIVRKSSDIVVGLDDSGLTAQSTLYDVRVDGSLYQEIYSANFLCLFLEYTDKFLTDNLTLCVPAPLRLLTLHRNAPARSHG